MEHVINTYYHYLKNLHKNIIQSIVCLQEAKNSRYKTNQHSTSNSFQTGAKKIGKMSCKGIAILIKKAGNFLQTISK